MKKSAITLLVFLLLSTLNFAQTNVEEAVRYRSNSEKTLKVKIRNVNVNESNYVSLQNILDNKSEAQLEELGARYAWAKSEAQLEELGARYGWAK